MINNIPDNFPTVSNIIINNQQHASEHNRKMSDSIANIHNQPVELMCLPAEIQHKIAFNLDINSYSNFRLASKEIKEVLPSFRAIFNSLKNGCSGTLKKDYEDMCRKSIISEIENKAGDFFVKILKNMSITPHPIMKNTTCNTIMFPDREVKIDSEWHYDYLADCAAKIRYFSNMLISPSMMVSSLGAGGNGWYIGIGIDNKEINNHTLDSIFKVYDEKFNTENNKNRFLAAFSAYHLKEYWSNTPLDGISKQDIIECTSRYQILFTTGEIIANLLSTKN